MTSPISTALGCTNAVGSTTGVTPLTANTFKRTGPPLLVQSSDPYASIAKHAHPWRVLLPLVGVPRHLHRPKHALGVWHQDGEATVGRRQAGDTTRRAIGVVWIELGHFVSIVDESKCRQRVRDLELRVCLELGVAFAVCQSNRYAAAPHAGKEKGRRRLHLQHRQPCLELLRAVAHEMRPARCPGDELAKIAHHLAAIAHAQRE